MTKNKWFIPFIVICAAVILVVITFAVLKKKSPTMGAVTTTKTTTAIVTTQAQQTVTITPPPATVIQTQTVTPPPSTTTETDTVTKTSVITPVITPGTTVTATSTVTTPVTTSVTTTITPTTTLTSTVTPTVVVTTTLPAVTTTATTTATVTTTATIPQLMFIGNITGDSNVIGNVVESAGSATLTVGTTTHTLGIANAFAANLADGSYGFVLQANATQKSALAAYFGSAGLTGTQLLDIIDEINGNKPFFYLNVSGSTFNVYDGFQYQLGNTTSSLVITGGYPTGSYNYTGTLTGTNGANNLNVTITLKVQ